MSSANSTRKSFLIDLAATLRTRIEAEVTGFDPDPAACQARRQRAWNDFEYFVATYFLHYVRSSHKSETGAIAAPRGEAKSTLVSQLFVLWCIVTGRKRYPVIVMDSIDQAYPMLEAIKAEFSFNPRLAMDFPEATGGGRVCQAGTIVTANDAKMQVAGSGKKAARPAPWPHPAHHHQ